MFQGCSHVIFLHQTIRDLKVCSHLFPCSALASTALAFDGLLHVFSSQANFSCRIIVRLDRGNLAAAMQHHVIVLASGGPGHALLPFVNVCASVECLNFDPAYDWVGLVSVLNKGRLTGRPDLLPHTFQLESSVNSRLNLYTCLCVCVCVLLCAHICKYNF